MADLKERFRSIYSDGINNAKLMHEMLKPKQEGFDEYAKREDAEDARKMFTGNGRQYGIQKGLEGFDTTLTVLGSAATPVAKGTKDVTGKLPQNNKQIWQDQINGEAEGENELKNVAGGEGQKYNTTKASLNTKGVSAKEGIRLKRAFNELKEYFVNDNFGLDKDVDLTEFEGKQVEVPANDMKKQANVKGAMLNTTRDKMEAAAKAGFETTSEHQEAGHNAYEARRYKTYEIPKDSRKEEAKKNEDKWGSTINSGKTYEQRYEDTRKKNTATTEIGKKLEQDILPNVYSFMDYLDKTNPSVSAAIRQGAAMNLNDFAISDPNSQNPSKAVIKGDLRSPELNKYDENLRKNHPNEMGKILGHRTDQLANQLESLSDKAVSKYAQKLFGMDATYLKSLPKKSIVRAIAALTVQLAFSEEADKSVGENESPWTTDAQWQAMANAEQFNDWRGATASKYAPLFINDWLEKFSIDDVDDEDKETYKKLASIMRGYNSSRGSAIRSSGSTPKVILSDPTFVELFEKYNDPIMNKLRK